MTINLWKPEPDVILHQGLGKACEEASELAQILARCMIQGLAGADPGTGKQNREALFEEIADMDAAVQWLKEIVGDDYDEERADRKLTGFRRWQKMLQDDLAAEQVQSPITELRLCETRHTAMKAGRRYIFTVDPKCAACVQMAAMGEQDR